MNYTKLIFSFKKRRHNLLIFRNFTILLTGMILLSTTGALAQKGNVSVNINNGTVKGDRETNPVYIRLSEQCPQRPIESDRQL